MQKRGTCHEDGSESQCLRGEIVLGSAIEVLLNVI